MSPPATILAAACLLALPWLLLPRPRQKPEIRGFKRVLWWMNAFYCAFWHRLQVLNAAPLPEHGPAILIANHTCGIDHMILQAGCRRVLGFMIAQEYYDNPFCRPFCHILSCIPVRRDGRDVAATRAALRALDQGRVVPIFPEGRITPTSGRELGPAKAGAAFIALHARVPVVPAYIRGTPETNNIVKSLYTPSDTRLTFGPPVDLSRFYDCSRVDKESVEEATEILMDAIRALRAAAMDGEPHPAAPTAEAESSVAEPEPAHALQP
jgi:1-acyl-sn-glycerol-3-phosphate acyltransferase